MKRLIPLACTLAVLATLATIPSSASAWTHCGTPQAESDCPPITACVDGVEQQVPDDGTYQSGECPKPPTCEEGQIEKPDGGCENQPPPTIHVCRQQNELDIAPDEKQPGDTEGQCVPEETVPVCIDGKDVMLPRDQVKLGGEGTCEQVERYVVCRDGKTESLHKSELLPTDTPGACPPPAPKPKPHTHQKVHIGPPTTVLGKEQQNPKDKPQTVAATQAGDTLPFTGYSPWPLVALGSFLLMGGSALRRRVQQ